MNLVCSANIAYSRALPDGIVEVMSEGIVRANRAVWDLASQKHVRDYDELLEEARTGEPLTTYERKILGPLLRRSPLVVHLQSGHSLEDIAIVRARCAARSRRRLQHSGSVGRSSSSPGAWGDVLTTLWQNYRGSAHARRCADRLHRQGRPIGRPTSAPGRATCAPSQQRRPDLSAPEAIERSPLYAWDRSYGLRPIGGYFNCLHVNDIYPSNGAVEWRGTWAKSLHSHLRGRAPGPDPALSNIQSLLRRRRNLNAAVCNGASFPNTFSLSRSASADHEKVLSRLKSRSRGSVCQIGNALAPTRTRLGTDQRTLRARKRPRAEGVQLWCCPRMVMFTASGHGRAARIDGTHMCAGSGPGPSRGCVH